MNQINGLEMRGIYKRFGDVVASNHVDFALQPGEIHALLGENGAGKSTLMRILFGLYQADAGTILVNEQPVTIHSPKEAISHGIGMVNQHFALVPPLTVAENVVLGATNGIQFNLAKAVQEVAAAAKEFGIPVDPAVAVSTLSVGEQQRVEILKALYRRAKILILDEPTAVLIPQEVDQLFDSLRLLRERGYSIVFISHKLHEVMAITDRVSVLRHGEKIGTVNTVDVTQTALAEMMVGRPTFGVNREATENQNEVVLNLEGINMRDKSGRPILTDINLDVRKGEVLGVAGVSGNGQVDLAQLLEGTKQCETGRVSVNGQDVTNASPSAMMAASVGRIPENCRANVVGEMTVAQNMALEHLEDFIQRGTLDRKQILDHAKKLINDYQIKASPTDKMRTLSGGNLQKVILARVLERRPNLIVVSQPTRGLDVGATEYVRQKLLEQAQRGAAVLLISEDLDEIIALSDRIAVMYEGQIMGIVPAVEANISHIGLLMSGVKEAAPAQ